MLHSACIFRWPRAEHRPAMEHCTALGRSKFSSCGVREEQSVLAYRCSKVGRAEPFVEYRNSRGTHLPARQKMELVGTYPLSGEKAYFLFTVNKAPKS